MNDKEKFLDIYPEYDLTTLPKWIRDDINNIYVEGKKKKTLVNLDGKKYNLDNKLNHLSGAEWVFFTNSVINTNYSTRGEDDCGYKYRKIHPTPKPPVLMKNIIEFFTKENDIVLDYFMGVGGTLLGASMSNRRAIGIDLNLEYIEAYKKASESMNYPSQQTICGNSLDVMKSNEFKKILNKEFVSLVLIDPPYGNMMSKEKTGDDIKKYGKNSTPFTNDANDLGNMSRSDFLKTLKNSVKISLKHLKNNGYVAVFIKDLQPNGKELNLLHYEIINELNKIPNLYYKGLKIWADQTAKLYPYGYPFSYVATQIHQYILFFRKEDQQKKKS